MKILIFGTGTIYQQLKNRIRSDVTVVGFLDNSEKKQGTLIDGKRVYEVKTGIQQDYEIIFLMSDYHVEMREQLIWLGVSESRIFDINRPNIVFNHTELKIYGDIDAFNKKLIVLFNHSLTSTGAQNVLFQAARIMKRNNYDVVVISKEDGILREKYLSAAIPVIICEDIISNRAILDALLFKTCLIWVNTLWLYYIADFLENYDMRILWWIHELSSASAVSRRVFRRIASNPQMRILSVGEMIDSNIRELYGDDIPLKRLLFGLEDYHKQLHLYTKEKIIFACIGGISRIKGQDLLIDAVQGMSEEIKQKAEFWIVGSGILDEHHQKIVEQNECIQVTGEIDNSEMPDLYRKLDGIICCSRVESMSVVVAEACMNMKFSIVSSMAGISRLLHDNNDALFFKSEDVLNLREKIVWCINNTDAARRLGQASRKVYERYFKLEAFENELKDLLYETVT